jgi:hypothetical protein
MVPSLLREAVLTEAPRDTAGPFEGTRKTEKKMAGTKRHN